MSGLITIFTDGACSGNPGPGGWGVIVSQEGGQTIELAGADRATTNNRMELIAAIRALEAVLEPPFVLPNSVVIYADSKYVLDGIQKWVTAWKRRGWVTSDTGEPVKNRDLWEQLDRVHSELQKRAKCRWNYVEAHAGISANERVDELAVAAAASQVIDLFNGPSSRYPISLDVPAPDVKGKPYYLSLIGGKVFRDETWPACQARVTGARGAKYKKCRSPREEAELLKSWGYSK